MQVLTHFPLLKALGWALFNSLWQMAALWLLYSLLMAIFRSAAARIRHSLALLSISLGSLWTVITFFAALFFADNSNNALLTFLSPAQSAPGWFWQTSRAFMDVVLSYGSSLYLLTLGGLLVRCSGHYWHTRRLTRKGLSTMPPEFRVFVAATALQLGIRKPVRTWLSSLIDVPLTLGFLKPVILLPVAMISQLSTQQVEAILVHELGHIRRKDYLLHLFVTVLEGLFFFNPFTRLLIRQLKQEREHCCDDLVLQFKYDPHAYVSALLSLAAYRQPGRKLAVAATGGSEKLLLERARRILLQQDGNRARPGMRSMLLLLFTALITTLALYRPLLRAHRTVQGAVVSRTSDAPSGSTAKLQTLSVSGTASSVPANPATVSGASSSASGEISQSIRSVPPPVTPSRQRLLARHRRPAIRQTEIPEPDGDNAFVNAAGEAVGSDDDGPTPFVASADEMTAANAADGSAERDFSWNTPAPLGGPSITLQQGAPIVPNTSFSYQYTVGDSSRPEEKLLYLQLSSQREVLAAISKLQEQTATQLRALTTLRTKASESVGLRRQIQAQEKKIQLDYLRKINLWQQKLQKTAHIRVVVYI